MDTTKSIGEIKRDLVVATNVLVEELNKCQENNMLLMTGDTQVKLSFLFDCFNKEMELSRQWMASKGIDQTTVRA